MNYHLLSGDNWISSYTSLPDAEESRAWQQVGGFDNSVICVFDRNLNAFVDIDSATQYRPLRFPYTKEAWANRCAAIHYNPPKEN
jgi:hypothetical protein